MPGLPEEYYQALLDKNADYDGVFYVGVTTTGVFCRVTCTARKPKFEHCQFYPSTQAALDAGFRPCKRCHPLETETPAFVQQLIDAVDAQPERKWRAADFQPFHTDISTVRRHFKRRFGLTFAEYVRARRMGLAVVQLQAGAAVIDAQIASGYESGSGFRDAFARLIGAPPTGAAARCLLYTHWFETRLGLMLAVGDEEHLLLLEFAHRRRLEREIAWLRRKTGAALVPGSSAPLRHIEAELRAYFAGQLRVFSTPIRQIGSPFQMTVWSALQTIPYGETVTYSAIAAHIAKPTAVRAVGNANGANPLAIIVPCHRVIGADGALTGYGGGLPRKRWLLNHEQENLR